MAAVKAKAEPKPATRAETPAAPVKQAQGGATEAEAKAFIYFKESTNNPKAINASSGACGLGQALPCSKLPCSLDDRACQDEWFTNYMKGRYGSWSAAKAYWGCIGECTNKYGTVTKTATWW